MVIDNRLIQFLDYNRLARKMFQKLSHRAISHQQYFLKVA